VQPPDPDDAFVAIGIVRTGAVLAIELVAKRSRAPVASHECSPSVAITPRSEAR
jgi:hypothetical protein